MQDLYTSPRPALRLMAKENSMDMHGEIAEDRATYTVTRVPCWIEPDYDRYGLLLAEAQLVLNDSERAAFMGVKLLTILHPHIYGWTDKGAADIADLVKHPLSSIEKGLWSLHKRNIILIERARVFPYNHNNKIGINPDTTAWQHDNKLITDAVFPNQEEQGDCVSKSGNPVLPIPATPVFPNPATPLKESKRTEEIREKKRKEEGDALRATASVSKPEPTSPFQPYPKEDQLANTPLGDISPLPKEKPVRKTKADDTPIESLFRTLFASRYPGKTWGGSQTDRDALVQLVRDKGEDAARNALAWWMVAGRADRSPSTPKWAINPTSLKAIYAFCDRPIPVAVGPYRPARNPVPLSPPPPILPDTAEARKARSLENMRRQILGMPERI